MAHLQLKLGPGEHAKVVLDGQDIAPACTALELTATAAGERTLTLTLGAWETEVQGDVQVVLSKATRDLLTRFGWTPPANPEG